jgi:hypothetical protein
MQLDHLGHVRTEVREHDPLVRQDRHRPPGAIVLREVEPGDPSTRATTGPRAMSGSTGPDGNSGNIAVHEHGVSSGGNGYSPACPNDGASLWWVASPVGASSRS